MNEINQYETQVFIELSTWQNKMLRRPSFVNKLSKKVQTKVNGWIPEKVHSAITTGIKQMIRAVLLASL